MYGYKIGLKKVGESVPAAPANVVQPSLVGNGAVGSVVTCNPGAWSGSPSPTFTFNFKLDTVSVQSSASNTYTPLIGDDTKTLTCTVTATNTEGSANANTSNSLIVGTIPNNTVAPVISGTNTFGSTLTTTNGTFTGTAPLTYTYQWRKGSLPISGQTAQTYVIGASDSLAAITCEVKATNSYGFDSEVSNTITVQDFAPINTVAPTVSPSGTQSTGALITANVGTWTGVAPITYEYKWTRNGVAISGATASNYTIQLVDDGTTIRVEVKGTNTYGTSVYIASSNSVSAVNVIAPTNSVAPVISGTAVVGQTLTSTTGTWNGIPTPTYSYQWKRGATNIGTNSSTYTLVSADAGQSITCVVTATNAGGSANATSNALSILATVLDVYPNSSSAYSLRLLSGSFFNSAIIKVRSSAANAEANVFINSAYEVAMDSNVTVTAAGTSGLTVGQSVSLTTFVNSGGVNQSAFTVTWYDQSGNARNATQTSPTQQPILVNAGVLEVNGGKASLRFIDSSITVIGAFMTIPVWHTAAQQHVFAYSVYKSLATSVSTPNPYVQGSIANDRGLILMHISGNIRTGTVRSSLSIGVGSAGFVQNVTMQRTDRANRTNITAWKNGTQVLNIADSNTNFNMPTNYYFGNTNAGDPNSDINFSEYITYVTDESANRANLEINQKTFYGIV